MMSGGLQSSRLRSSVKFAAVRTASALILQGKATSDNTDKLGAKLMAAPPDRLVLALPDNTVAGQEQHEFVGNDESGDMEPHAAV
jgi:hypothetical protein